MSPLLFRPEGRIALITVNRPKVLNALDDATIQALHETITASEKDDAIGAIILTGAGEKAFVAGGDLSTMPDLSPAEAREYARSGHLLMNRIAACRKPVIAAVNGYALGGGCELAIACDIRYASENARFGLPEVSLGIIPGFGGTQRLPQLIGPGRALEMVLGGEMIDAREAERIGLVNRVCTSEELLPKTIELAERILSKGPHAVQFAKEAVRYGLQVGPEIGWKREADLFGLCFDGGEAKEGISAFLEKRPARFSR